MNSRFVDALIELGTYLKSVDYEFVTVTPLTHERALRNRASRVAGDLRDAFGWNLPFDSAMLPSEIRERLRDDGLIVEGDRGLCTSSVRFSCLHEHIYAHSGFPTTQADAVFFGPDTYRFVTLIETELAKHALHATSRVLDMGCGGGPGGIAAALGAGSQIGEVVLADINAVALQFCRANAELAGVSDKCVTVHSDLFASVEGEFDLIVSNPPYLMDAGKRTYRHGGGDFGEGLSQRILEQSVSRLKPGGRTLLYTGSAVLKGVDPFSEWAQDMAARTGCSFKRREIDPDVFGEELDRSEYRTVDRIAAVGIILERPSR